MGQSREVQSLGWTRRNVGINLLLAMEEHRKEAGRRLAALRDSRGLTQDELAHEAGVSVKTVSRFENGRHDGRRTTVRQIAKALGVDEADILGPPLDPLGLGATTQLDRIEQTLSELREAVATLAADNLRLSRGLEDLRGKGRRKGRGEANDG